MKKRNVQLLSSVAAILLVLVAIPAVFGENGDLTQDGRQIDLATRMGTLRLHGNLLDDGSADLTMAYKAGAESLNLKRGSNGTINGQFRASEKGRPTRFRMTPAGQFYYSQNDHVFYSVGSWFDGREGGFQMGPYGKEGLKLSAVGQLDGDAIFRITAKGDRQISAALVPDGTLHFDARGFTGPHRAVSVQIHKDGSVEVRWNPGKRFVLTPDGVKP